MTTPPPQTAHQTITPESIMSQEIMAEFVRRAIEQRLRREEARLRASFAKMDPSAWNETETDLE